MNLYEVVSETLYEVVPILDFGQGPEEPYRIYEKVVAETPAKAKPPRGLVEEICHEEPGPEKSD